MPGRHQIAPTRRFSLRWILGAALAILVAATTALGLAITPANAATTVNAQLTLTGVADKDNPLGGSVIGIHPGDSVSITTATVPTAGLDKLGLGGLLSNSLGSLVGLVAGYQSVADFSHLPGGKSPTTVRNSPAVTFTFPKAGTYTFTWSVQALVLGNAVPLNLNSGNQLAKAGVKLNASNQYVGEVVVSDNPPSGGIGIQLPSVGAQPSLPVVGQLPSIGVPGVNPPTLSLPTLPSLPIGGKQTQPSNPGNPGNPGSGNGGGGDLPVADGVVPHGDNANVYPGAGAGGFNALPLPNILNSNGGTSGLLPVPAAKSGAKATSKQSSAGKDKPIDLASNKSETGQLSVILAIIAVIALTLVAATYARLYVLRKN